MRQYLFLGRRFSEVKEPSMAMQDRWIKARGGLERTSQWLAQRKQRMALSPVSYTLFSLPLTGLFTYENSVTYQMIIPNTSSSCLPVMLLLCLLRITRGRIYTVMSGEGGSKCPSNIISNNNNISRRPWKNYYHLNYKTCKHFPPTLNNTLNPRGDLSANCIKISLGIEKVYRVHNWRDLYL